jgi:hypothetical protein
MNDLLMQKDALQEAMSMARKFKGESGLVGYGTIALFDGDGELSYLNPFANLITDAGDLYYATKAIVGISPSGTLAPTAVNGMKLGNQATPTAPTKAGTAAALQAYKTASNVAFDATYPQTANLGTGAGVNAVYKTTWGAGVATDTALTEAVIVNDQATNATSTAANTIARVTFSAVAKGSADTLAITWNHKMLGA